MTRYERLIWLKEWYNDHRGELQTQPSMVAAIRANREVKHAIYDLYFALKNKTLGGCGSCEADALIFLLSKKTEDNMKKITECRFKLKQGVLLTDTHGNLPDATCANLTDEVAIAYLKDNPARARFFAEIPEDLNDEEATDEETEAEAEKSHENSTEAPEVEQAKETEANTEKSGEESPAEVKPAKARKSRTAKK